MKFFDFKNSKDKNGYACEVLGCLSNFNLKKNFFFLNFGIFKNALVTDDVTGSGKMENARNNNVKYKILVNEHLNQFIFPLSFNWCILCEKLFIGSNFMGC